MSESRHLQKTHFYVPCEYVDAIAPDYDGKLSVFVGANFSFDLIEQPFHCVATSADGAVELKLYVRGEMGAFLQHPDLDIIFFKEPQESKKQFKIVSSTGRIGNAGQLSIIFLEIVKGISTFTEKNELISVLSNIDTESEGFLIKLDGDELLFKKVSGKQRPSMACKTLFGGVQMMRPYANEIIDSWICEKLSLEEKVELAKAGNEEMMEQLAMIYLNGDDEVESDPEKSVYWFTKLAELDNPEAQFNMGLFCAEGYGIERSLKNAVYWLEQAAENGCEDALALIEKLKKGIDAEEIVSTCDAQAQADLAEVYMVIGNSFSQTDSNADYAIAFEYAQKSAAQNNGDGLWTLALAYEHGRGVEQSIPTAIEYYRKGAEIGHAPSQHSLACYYLRGDTLEQDYKKAFDLLMKSAAQGYGLAMADVGRCYQFGYGVTGNMKTAVEWYEKALTVIDDPELERKTAIFKMLGENDEHWGEDYLDTDEDTFDDKEDDPNIPDGFMEALEVFSEAEEYENKLADEGVLPDVPRSDNAIMHLSPEDFPRITLKAEEGDEMAIAILAKMKAPNEID